jgi:hypothetical protein
MAKITSFVTEGQPTIYIEKSIGLTINSGNYTSVKVEEKFGCAGTLDHYDELNAFVIETIEEQMSIKLAEVREMNSGMLTL